MSYLLKFLIMNKSKCALTGSIIRSQKKIGGIWIKDLKAYRKYPKGADAVYKVWRKSLHNLVHHICE